MGFDVGATEAHGFGNRARCRLLGQAMDVHSVVSLLSVCRHMSDAGVASAASFLHDDHARHHGRFALACRCMEESHDVSSAALVITGQDPDDLNDIWHDTDSIAFLRNGILPANSADASRVRKCCKWYKYKPETTSLHRFVKDKTSGQLAFRRVPEPGVRSDLVMATHESIGHLGEKRTIHALSQLYWWHGLTVDVKRHLSTCKLCRRVGVSPPHQVQDMQTEAHDDYGMFYRWGLDYLGELPPSAAGNRYAFIAVDYYTKWVEVFAVPKHDAATTTKHALLDLVARYGVPAEIVCDNGPPFKGLF
jgi:hypothetical protein